MRDSAAGAVERMMPFARQHKIRVEVTGEKGEGVFDSEIFRRVFDNLVSNAINACEPGALVTVNIRSSGSAIRAEVRDPGRGIDPKFHDTIFDQFALADEREAVTKSGSFGVGLAFCKLAVGTHGGRIGLDSKVGCGSTFWFEFPAGPPSPTGSVP